MPRLTDADALKSFIRSIPDISGLGLEPVIAVRDVLEMIDRAPTIDAIPVEWLKAQINDAIDDNETELASDIDWLIRKYKNEQEAQDG